MYKKIINNYLLIFFRFLWVFLMKIRYICMVLISKFS